MTSRASLALCFVAAAGCVPGPEATLARYLTALRANKIEAAYALTTRRYRATHDLATFAAVVAARAELAPTRVRREPADVVIELSVAGAAPIVVEQHDGKMRLAEDPLDLYPNDSAEHALRSFARACTFDRRTQLARLLAPSLHERAHLGSMEPLDDELTAAGRTVARLLTPRAGFSAGVLQLGADNATLLLGDGHAVTLVHTQSGWVLSSIE